MIQIENHNAGLKQNELFNVINSDKGKWLKKMAHKFIQRMLFSV